MTDPRADAVAALDPSLEEGFYEAGFIDAYLNIRGVKDEAEARSMFAADWARFIERDRAALLAVLLDPETLAAAMAADEGDLFWAEDDGSLAWRPFAEHIIARLTAIDSTEPEL